MSRQPECGVENLPAARTSLVSQCAANVGTTDEEAIEVAPVVDAADALPCTGGRAEKDARPPGLA
eukprot:2791158-Alexandrium_andersonii.AAC.1